jgi:hypothetical protein
MLRPLASNPMQFGYMFFIHPAAQRKNDLAVRCSLDLQHLSSARNKDALPRDVTCLTHDSGPIAPTGCRRYRRAESSRAFAKAIEAPKPRLFKLQRLTDKQD